jgi:hypothetical protein
MDKYNDKNDGIRDDQNVYVTDHLSIRDVDTGVVLTNQQGSTRNYSGDVND